MPSYWATMPRARRKYDLAGRGQARRPVLAVEEADAEGVLERGDLHPDGRLGEVEGLCGAGEGALFGDRHQGLELADGHSAL